MNLVVLQGNLGKDPELRYAQSGNPVVGMSVATTEKRKDAQGNYTDDTQWHRVTAFGKTAENCAQYLKKGSKVLIEGMIKYGQYQDAQGQTRYTTDIVARRVNFLDPKGAGANQPQQAQTGPQPRPPFQGSRPQPQGGQPQGGQQQGGQPQGGFQNYNTNQTQTGFPAQGFDDDIPF